MWWQQDQSLAATIDLELAKPLHRERWKYTRAAKALDLVAVNDGKDGAPETKEPCIDIATQLTNAPEALIPFARGQQLTTVSMSDGDTILLGPGQGRHLSGVRRR